MADDPRETEIKQVIVDRIAALETAIKTSRDADIRDGGKERGSTRVKQARELYELEIRLAEEDHLQ